MALGTLALIGTLTSLAGTIGSGIGSAVKNKQMDTNLRNSLAQSETDANRELYSNPLTRRDNMAYSEELDLIQNVKKQLEASGVRVLGAVLNKVKMKKNSYDGSYYGGYYGGYYGSYYGNNGEDKKET